MRRYALLKCDAAVFVESDHYVVTFVGHPGCLTKHTSP